MRSQIVISKGKGGRRYLPYAFTEQGVAMLSSVLRSKRAIEVNIEIMRAFAYLRKLISSHAELALKLEELEKHLEDHDQQIQSIFEAIRQLMSPTDTPKRKIGFETREPKITYGKARGKNRAESLKKRRTLSG